MNYFVIQVMTGAEEKYVRLAEKALEQNKAITACCGRLIWLRRSLTIRKMGRKKTSLAPLFPGYLFWEGEEIFPELYWVLKKISVFIRFLKSNRNIEPLEGNNLHLLHHFLQFGDVAAPSQVFFDENSRIRVVHGPLKGLEGNIVKVDRRKKRAKVRLSLYENSFLVDFGFELMTPLKGEDE